MASNLKERMQILKTSVKKGSHTLKAKLGAVEDSKDEEYNTLKVKYDKTYKKMKETAKHFQSIIDNFHAVGTSLSIAVQDLEALYDQEDPMLENIANISKVINEFDTTILKNFQTQLTDSCIEPLMKHRAEYKVIRENQRRRDLAKIAWDEKHTEVKKLSSKQHKDPTKLPKAKERLSQLAEEYELASKEAKVGIVDLLNKKSSVLDPVVTGLSDSVTELSLSMVNTMSQLKENIQEGKSQPRRARFSICLQDRPVIPPEPEMASAAASSSAALAPQPAVNDLFEYSYTSSTTIAPERESVPPRKTSVKQDQPQPPPRSRGSSLKSNYLPPFAEVGEPSSQFNNLGLDVQRPTSTTVQPQPNTKTPSKSSQQTLQPSIYQQDPMLSFDYNGSAPALDLFYGTPQVPSEYNVDWYYLDAALVQQGPIKFDALKRRYQMGEFNDSTYLFGAADMVDWQQIGLLPKLRKFLSF